MEVKGVTIMSDVKMTSDEFQKLRLWAKEEMEKEMEKKRKTHPEFYWRWVRRRAQFGIKTK